MSLSPTRLEAEEGRELCKKCRALLGSMRSTPHSMSSSCHQQRTIHVCCPLFPSTHLPAARKAEFSHAFNGTGFRKLDVHSESCQMEVLQEEPLRALQVCKRGNLAKLWLHGGNRGSFKDWVDGVEAADVIFCARLPYQPPKLQMSAWDEMLPSP